MFADNFMNQFENKPKTDFTTHDLVKLLEHKDFPITLIKFVENIAKSNKHFGIDILNATSSRQTFRVKVLKQFICININVALLSFMKLKNMIPIDVVQDDEIQRLFSNLIIIKNMVCVRLYQNVSTCIKLVLQNNFSIL